MITGKIKSLFVFIEFLHSNIDNFNNQNDLIKEVEFLKAEKNKLNPKNNYKDKIKFDELQEELVSKVKILQDNTANLIKAKAKELDVCNFENGPNYSFNGVETEMHNLKESFKNEDLVEIFKHKNQYIEYRTTTHKNFLSLGFFFDDLDEITKSIFDFFKENEQNEFETFEKKTIEINSIVEAFSSPEKMNTKFVFATPLNKTDYKILNDRYKNYLVNKQPQQPEHEAIDTTPTEKIKLFDANHFNNDCYKLFNYLVDNYKKKGKIKFINIYYFLKDEVNKQKYSFNFIQDDYTIFIKTDYQVEIKKYQKAEFDFVEQKRILNAHEEQFRKQ